MAGRNHGGGRSGDYLLNDRQGTRSSCPATWKFAVAILLVCALFLIGVVIGYCISQAALGRRLDGSCQPVQQNARQKDTSVDDLEVLSDPRQMKMRHWNLVQHLQAADYSLPSDLVYAMYFVSGCVYCLEYGKLEYGNHYISANPKLTLT